MNAGRRSGSRGVAAYRGPYGEGWMIEIKLAEASAMDSLLNAEDYRILIGEA